MLVGVLLVVFASLLGAVGSLMFKLGASGFSLNPKKLLKNKTLLWGFVLYGGSTIPFIMSLKYGPVSVMYPIVSLNYVWSTMLSAKVLKENINAKKIGGLCLIILGVALIAS